MSLIAIVLTAFVALLHVGFMVLEMFFWTKPLGRRVFALTNSAPATRRSWPPTRGCTTASWPRAWSGACCSTTAGSACSSWAAW